ncbi:MAG: hypothetical protein IJ173_11335 [Kiritimatiellae bacterium]|nr:hypothetical protein [Kiritimatiellia bacterium]
MILDKKQMTEEDIKLQFITPAIVSRWTLDRITMETKITDGALLAQRRESACGTGEVGRGDEGGAK